LRDGLRWVALGCNPSRPISTRLEFVKKASIVFFREICWNQWESIKIDRNECKSLKIYENEWKSIEIYKNLLKTMQTDNNYWKSIKINENQWKSIKMNKHIENRWKSTEITENQSKYIKTINKKWNFEISMKIIEKIKWIKINVNVKESINIDQHA
jgi:hypothetical protein